VTQGDAEPAFVPSPPPHDADHLVPQHLPLVGHVVNDMLLRAPAHVERDDLASAGMLALVQAARAYDPTLGVPFSNYARTRIRGAILDEMRGADWAPRSVRSRARDVNRTTEALTARLGRRPAAEEVAAVLGIGVDDVRQARADLDRSVLSLDAFGGTLDETLPQADPTPEDRLLHSERLAYLRAAVEALPERLRTVVTAVYLQDRPMAEVAAELGVTESRVSQLRAEAMALLRDGMNAHLDPGMVPAQARPDGVAARRREAYYAQVAARAAYGAARPPAQRDGGSVSLPARTSA